MRFFCCVCVIWRLAFSLRFVAFSLFFSLSLRFFAFPLRVFCIFFTFSLRPGRPRLGEALERLEMQKNCCMFFAFSLRCFLHFLCVAFAFCLACSLRFLCVWGARGSERLWEGWKCQNRRRCCMFVAFSLHFFAFSLRFPCVWGARGSERLWEGWKYKKLGSVACFWHFFASFLHFLCVAFAFSLRCSLFFFASVARSLRRCTAAAQVVGLFQKQRQPQNANKRDTRTQKKCRKMPHQDAKNAKETHPECKIVISRISSLLLSKILIRLP